VWVAQNSPSIQRKPTGFPPRPSGRISAAPRISHPPSRRGSSNPNVRGNQSPRLGFIPTAGAFTPRPSGINSPTAAGFIPKAAGSISNVGDCEPAARDHPAPKNATFSPRHPPNVAHACTPGRCPLLRKSTSGRFIFVGRRDRARLRRATRRDARHFLPPAPRSRLSSGDGCKPQSAVCASCRGILLRRAASYEVPTSSSPPSSCTRCLALSARAAEKVRFIATCGRFCRATLSFLHRGRCPK